MKTNEWKNWIKQHKKQIFVTAAGIVVIVGGSVLGANLIWHFDPLVRISKETFGKINDIPVPEALKEKVTVLWTEEGYVNAIAHLSADDLGRFGEAMLNNVEEIDPAGKCAVIIGFEKTR